MKEDIEEYHRMSLNQSIMQMRRMRTRMIAPVTTRCWYILYVRSICQKSVTTVSQRGGKRTSESFSSAFQTRGRWRYQLVVANATQFVSG